MTHNEMFFVRRKHHWSKWQILMRNPVQGLEYVPFGLGDSLACCTCVSEDVAHTLCAVLNDSVGALKATK